MRFHNKILAYVFFSLWKIYLNSNVFSIRPRWKKDILLDATKLDGYYSQHFYHVPAKPGRLKNVFLISYPIQSVK